MIYTKKFVVYLFICLLFINNNITFGYPSLGELYKCVGQNNNEYLLLLLVDKKNQDNEVEQHYKASVVSPIKKLLSDNEVTLILDDRLATVSNILKDFTNKWSDEFEADPQWSAIIEQNYSNNPTSTISYKKMNLSPRIATKLFILLSKMKDHINYLPLKDHLNLVQKAGTQKDNNFFKSCYEAKDYFNLTKRPSNASAQVVFADWCTPTTAYITENYNNGLHALSQDLHLVDNQSWSAFLEDVARAFVPQTKDSTAFSAANDLKTKDLLNDLENALRTLNHLKDTSSNEQEKELWLSFVIRIQKIKEYILNSVALFQNLSHEDKNSFEQLFKAMPKYHYAQVHWFGIVYAYLLKDKVLNNVDHNEWTRILVEDLLHAGIMEAIISSKNKQAKAVVFLNENNYDIISQHLLHLGYSKALVIDNQNTGQPMSPNDLELLINQFPVNTLRIKQVLQKPLQASVTI